MQQPKALSVLIGQTSPIRPHLFQQSKRTVNVGTDEIIGPANGAVDVTFGGKMYDGARLVTL
jgi:hypothetical protein